MINWMIVSFGDVTGNLEARLGARRSTKILNEK
jgi:hypothetical protein